MTKTHAAKGIYFLLFLAFITTGCDMLSPKPKKNVKLSERAKSSAAAAVKPVSTEQTPAGDDEKSAVLPAGVLAKVGDWTLTLDEFNARIRGVKQAVKDFDETQDGAKESVLDELIKQQLLVYEGRQQRIEQTKDIRDAVRDFENTLIVQEVAAKLVKGIQATEQDARDFYDANPKFFIEPVEKKIREIVVSTESEAKEVLVSALQGADFAQLAREHSKGKSAANAGDLGYLAEVPFAQMNQEIDPLKKGEMSRVFNGPEGYYLVKVEDIRGGDKKAFIDVKEDLIKWVTSQKQQQAVLTRIDELAKVVKMQVNPELLKDRKK